MKNKRLAILKRSLEKKEAVLDARFATHFDSVKVANGHPHGTSHIAVGLYFWSYYE